MVHGVYTGSRSKWDYYKWHCATCQKVAAKNRDATSSTTTTTMTVRKQKVAAKSRDATSSTTTTTMTVRKQKVAAKRRHNNHNQKAANPDKLPKVLCEHQAYCDMTACSPKHPKHCCIPMPLYHYRGSIRWQGISSHRPS
jgi:hypothetical protein